MLMLVTLQTEVEAEDEDLQVVLDFAALHWTTERTLPERVFPLLADVDRKRYELYADGTFAEVES
jgi:hypothetical protein